MQPKPERRCLAVATGAHADVVWSEVATLDLDAIVGLIAERDLDLALSVMDRLRAAVSRLRQFPMRGRVVPELAEHGVAAYRELIVPPWRIVYTVLPGRRRVIVMAVMDGRRNVEDILLRRLLERP